MRKKNERGGLRLKELAFWESGQADRNLGFGLSFEKLPAFSSYNMLAFFYRPFVSFYDALARWAAEVPDAPVVREFGCLQEAREKKRECAKAIVKGLGRYRDDLCGAERALEEWCRRVRKDLNLVDENVGEKGRPRENVPWQTQHLPLLNTLWEINSTLRPLLLAFQDPKTFFQDVAPTLYPDAFSFPPADWPGTNEQRLASTLHTWGHAAHLNPSVQAALEIAASGPRVFAHVLGVAEQRKAYREGRRKGSKDGPHVARRVSHENRLEAVDTEVRTVRSFRREYGEPLRGVIDQVVSRQAEAEKRSPAAIRKSRAIARKRRVKTPK